MTIEGDLQSLPAAMRERLEASGVTRAWNVSAASYGPRAFGVGEEGVFVVNSEAEADLYAPWADVIELSFPSQFQGELKLRGHEPVLMTLLHLRHRKEMLNAIPEGERPRVEPSGFAAGGGSTPAPATFSAAPAARPDPAGEAVATLWWVLIIGMALQVVGGMIIGASWPDGLSEFNEQADDGSTGGLLFGWLLGGAGSFLLLVAVVGFGTMLGIRAARQRR